VPASFRRSGHCDRPHRRPRIADGSDPLVVGEPDADIHQDSVSDRNAAHFRWIEIAITFAVIGAVIGEFVGSENGLGYLILVSTSQSRTPLAFGALVLLTVMSILLYYGIAFMERIVVPWAPRN
jgi:ABC-type proline/glycine betaine transport system permease subunit